MRTLEDQTFLLLLVVVSVAFGWILSPYYQAVLWALVLAIMFTPLNRNLLRFVRQRRNLAALLSVAIIAAIVIVPVILIASSLAQEASNVYESIESGELNLGKMFRQVVDALPAWATHLLDRFGLSNLAGVQERLSTGLLKGTQAVAGRALTVGQSTFEFVTSLAIMLYLLFFLLRDGESLSRSLMDSIPLRSPQRTALFDQFATVIRATVKGDVLVAAVQGALGGLIFWFLGVHAALLLAVLMAFVSLVPAIGAALVWLPVAIYIIATGVMWQGVLLIAYGVFVIGLADNVLRPILVGKDTKMPDYVVLLSTLGGLAIFSASGLVIGPVIAAMFIATWAIFAHLRQTGGKPPSSLDP
jgi:predicted PurR-regulated permease PerM